jgi:hypothetical protein
VTKEQGDCGLHLCQSENFLLQNILKEKMYSNYAITADDVKKEKKSGFSVLNPKETIFSTFKYGD